MDVHIGYGYIPPNATAEQVGELRAQVAEGLLSFVNFNKEPHSLLQSVAGRYILQKMLVINSINIDNISLSSTNYKKPIILNSYYKFNISHSGDLVVCALSKEREVGIDVELVKQIAVSDFRMQFSAAEYAELAVGGDLKKFYRIWTAKEAISKAMGSGLYLEFNKIEREKGSIFQVEQERWVAEEILIDPGYVCTVALNESFDQKYLHQFNIELKQA